MEQDRETILRFIRKVIDENVELKYRLIRFEKDKVLFNQGERLPFLYLMLEGWVTLAHTRKDGTSLNLANLGPGNFIGLIAFNTGNASLTTCTVLEETLALQIAQDEFDEYLNDHPQLRQPLQHLMLNNMTDRFVKNVRLEAEMNTLNQQLEAESAELKKAYQQLEESHKKLVHQEKMATLGELVAGFAHEVNNPAAALLRCSETLKDNFIDDQDQDPLKSMFTIGLDAEPISSSEVRGRMEMIKKRFPQITDRSSIRKLAQMPDVCFDIIDEGSKQHDIDELIRQFESGKLIHNIEIASERIANLVKSLKSYSRQDSRDSEMIDLREGLKDTILILSNRLKYLDLQLDLQEIPLTCGKMGELNQVWTNILVNACDILDEKGQIIIRCWAEVKSIFVEISDNGPGIPKAIIDRIFDPNFTTKNQGAKFGLGLGLAISEQIVKEHGGQISAENRKEKGARFLIKLPVKDC